MAWTMELIVQMMKNNQIRVYFADRRFTDGLNVACKEKKGIKDNS